MDGNTALDSDAVINIHMACADHNLPSFRIIRNCLTYDHAFFVFKFDDIITYGIWISYLVSDKSMHN